MNSSPAVVFKNGQWADSNWTEIHVGDFVKVKENEFFPADLILLSSSLEQGVCFIETAALDG
jgi:phospholipid-transporting ATPase